MKNPRIFTLVAVLAVLPLSVCFSMPGLGVVGNGKVVESERTVSAFTSIASGGSAEVRVHRAKATRVVVTTDENIQEYFNAEVSGGILSLGYKPVTMISRVTKLVVDVYMPSLEAITVSGSGNMSLVDSFKGDSFSATVSGSGSFAGSINYDTVAVKLSGSGKVRLDGSSDRLTVVVSGSGKFDCARLSTKSADMILSGSGDAELTVSGRLDARISGSGSVRYGGKPEVNASISGSGRVRNTGK